MYQGIAMKHKPIFYLCFAVSFLLSLQPFHAIDPNDPWSGITGGIDYVWGLIQQFFGWVFEGIRTFLQAVFGSMSSGTVNIINEFFAGGADAVRWIWNSLVVSPLAAFQGIWVAWLETLSGFGIFSPFIAIATVAIVLVVGFFVIRYLAKQVIPGM